jgi:acyl-CoA synthetase (AMP-forming)/AMP-acid ligase II
MKDLLTLGQMLSVHARLSGDRLGARDLDRSLTFAGWNDRACRLANALLGWGLRKGERVAVLAYNTLEWLEIYMAASKAGLIVVPIHFRLVAQEVRFIIENAGAAAVIVQDELTGVIDEIRAGLSVRQVNYVHFGKRPCPARYRDYEELLGGARGSEPPVTVTPSDPWTMMYTSGTTGNPKGVLRSNRSLTLLALATAIELGLNRNDGALLVMPMCHANSLNFFSAFAYCGGVTAVYSRKSFDPEHCVRSLAEGSTSFTSLVPTHYIMMLGLAPAVRAKYDLSNVTKLMISSAPARQETKRAVMEMFRNSGLYELYGATEVGWATMLHPHEQYTKLGSVGQECVGSAPIRLLDENGDEVRDGKAGELYCSTPYTFSEYWGLPEKSAAAFKGEYCTVGDMARRDEEGYIHLVDRKSNMIISGGENVYPSDVEAVIGAHPLVKDVAVVGLPDQKWGERVHAAAVLKEGATLNESELLDWCKDGLAGYKRPRACSFLRDEDMPRNATGKVMHRMLKTQLQG